MSPSTTMMDQQCCASAGEVFPMRKVAGHPAAPFLRFFRAVFNCPPFSRRFASHISSFWGLQPSSGKTFLQKICISSIVFAGFSQLPAIFWLLVLYLLGGDCLLWSCSNSLSSSLWSPSAPINMIANSFPVFFSKLTSIFWQSSK